MTKYLRVTVWDGSFQLKTADNWTLAAVGFGVFWFWRVVKQWVEEKKILIKFSKRVEVTTRVIVIIIPFFLAIYHTIIGNIMIVYAELA